MKEQRLEERVQRAFDRAVPDVLEQILSDCNPNQATEKGSVIPMTKQYHNTKKTAAPRRWWKPAAGLAAAALLFVGVGMGWSQYQAERTVNTWVSLDVNPSVEIQVNRKDKVLDVVPLNQDGKTVLGEMDFSGSDLDVTVNALIGSMLRNGYLSELANSILISVDSQDPDKGAALQSQLAEEVNQLLQTDTFTGAVLSQQVTENAEGTALAEQYGITQGKAQLILQIAAQNPNYTADDLVALSINELNLLRQASSQTGQQLAATGTASDKSYIGREKAQTIALNHAGVSAAKAVNRKAELDYEDGRMVYEVEFTAAGYEYDYELDAITGEILRQDKEREDDGQTGNPGNTGNTGSAGSYIGQEKAKTIALNHAKVSADKAANLKAELDEEDGQMVYQVEFQAGGYEYDYDINAATGKILQWDKEAEDDDNHHQHSSHHTSGNTGNAGSTGNTGNTGSTGSAASQISQEKAKSIALNHAKVSAGDVREYEAEKDKENGVTLYEIEFKAGGYEYEYDINAATGAIVKYDKEKDD